MHDYECALPVKISGTDIHNPSKAWAKPDGLETAYRVTGTCMTMGQVAGLAAAVAAGRRVEPGDIDGAELHDMLRYRGVKFLPRVGKANNS